MMMREAAKEYNYNLNFPAIATMWMGGCIIRSVFLSNIYEAFGRDRNLKSLLLDPFFEKALKNCQDSWRNVVSKAALCGIPAPAISAALSFFDGYRSARLPANLIQAQRDYFGAHTFEWEDEPGNFVHHDWIQSGSKIYSGTYNA
jgi:6-phosphogluconate dehydrogenase